MTNLDILLSEAKDLEVIGNTSVWSFHTADHLDNLARKKGTNIYKAIESLKGKGVKGGITLYVDRVGRSGHSKSNVVILKGITNINDYSEYYSRRIGEVFI